MSFKSFSIVMLFSLFLVSCGDENFHQSPNQVKLDKFEEISEIEKKTRKVQPFDQELVDYLEALVSEGVLTKVSNGTEPLIVEVQNFHENLLRPVHDKVQVEEYFVADEKGSAVVHENAIFNPDEGVKLLNVRRRSTLKAAWNGHPRGSEYTEYVKEGLLLYGDNLLSRDIDVDHADFCPRYNRLRKNQRIQFWVMFISSIAEHESAFRTNAKYREKNGRYSRGLLQFGFRSTRGYGCGFRNQYELNKDPERNLHCGVRVIDNWVSKDRVIINRETRRWRGAARYWSVLRFNIWPRKKRNRLLGIKRNTNALSFCK